MWIGEAITYVQREAARADDIEARNTLWNIAGLLPLAAAPTAREWSAKIEQVVAYVLAGHYGGTYYLARRILDRKSYPPTITASKRQVTTPTKESTSTKKGT